MSRRSALTTAMLLIVTATLPCAVFADDLGMGFLEACVSAKRSAGIPDAVGGANSGIQVTPDGLHLLVSKDVGTERWAIAGLVADDSLSGNVFRTDGGAPAFVWCRKTADDQNPDFQNRLVTYSCSGADACPVPPCGGSAQWSLINDHVQLRGGFFLP